MMRNFLSFVLRSRLEDVMAVGVSAGLLVLFLTTEVFHSFNFGILDFLFILLPVGILGVKSLFGLLLASEPKSGENPDTGRFLIQFFQPLLKIFRDWFPFLLLSACYYSLYSNLILQVNPHKADAFLSKIDAFILGNQPSFLLEPFIRPWITDFLYSIYF